jgi:superfamily II DNA or RNA helicase
MRLSQVLAPQVSQRSRSRGHAYFIGGAVHNLTARDGGIDATVQGSEPYFVRLEASSDLLTGSCTCPYFSDRLEICKHVWATILAAEARSLPLLPPGTRPDAVELAPMDPDDDPAAAPESDFEEDLDEDWPSLEEADARPLSPAGRASVSARMKLYWAERRRAQGHKVRQAAKVPAPPPPEWQRLLDGIAGAASPADASPPRLSAGQLLYVIDVAASRAAGVMVVELMTRDRKKNGDWGKPRPITIARADIRSLPDPDERHILERLCGVHGHLDYGGWADPGIHLSRFRLAGVLVSETIPRFCATGRCMARLETPGAPQPANSFRHHPMVGRRPEPSPLAPIQWDAGPPWRFLIEIRRNDAAREYIIDGWLARDGERMDMAEPLLVLADDVVLTRTHAAGLNHCGAFAWLAALRRTGRVTVPIDARVALIDTLLAQPPELAAAPEELRVEAVCKAPRYGVRLRPARGRSDRLLADLTFTYGDIDVPADAPGLVVRSADATRAVRRDPGAEQHALDTLRHLGCRKEWTHYDGEPMLQLATHLMPRVVRELLAQGWHVEADGRIYREPQHPQLDLRSGIDWFELHGRVDYGEQHASLPALLAALERGESFVTLGDGSVGLLPEQWLRKHAVIAQLGSPEDDHIRFKPSQTALLDALLAAQPEVTWDAAFDRARARLKTFEGLRPLDPAASFVGALRDYQRDGLGWFAFLEQFGFGGCLADDMGLGKTVMVLAWLDRRREPRQNGERRPSLAVVPRSLVFNWRAEASRFTPRLRLLEYTGTGRADLESKFDDADLVLTTYGTLRRDAGRLTARQFDYVVLDESQAIKNAKTASAKACRLLNARHRLALSGTPIENHLGELGSLFEFLNPGLLGRSAFTHLARAGVMDEEAIGILARGLRPFILRRTKDQVARELPPKTEQTIACELKRPQRVLYDELRDHYRRALLGRVRTHGLGRAKLQILEALLRLRQAACHPGLIDRGRSSDTSAKLEVLLPRIREAVDEGHKTLVFSQFTSLLAIVRARLDADGVSYEYLDGSTRDRAGPVARFQNDADCRLFLISLKAGGLGLNLTAAEYVFLLDPWWNPAVEAQAIDRAHRIGQARHVFAYRLIARDTVEERVLELQQRKRRLADAILMADNALIRDLTRDDLELLLS